MASTPRKRTKKKAAKTSDGSEPSTRKEQLQAIQALLGPRLKRVRKTAAQTQEDLALSADIDLGFVSGIERGVRNPSVGTVVLLADALGVEPASLLDFREQATAGELRDQIKRRLRALDHGQLAAVLRIMDAVRF